MRISDKLISELRGETPGTRKLIERVPDKHMDWKPHEKSMSLRQLAGHIVNLHNWIPITLNQTELDFATAEFPPPVVESTEALLKELDRIVAEHIALMETFDDARILEPWTMRHGDTVYFTMPKAHVIRTFVLNHLYHHRGQLSVYLRLLDVPLPGLYGPTADEQMMG